MSNPWPFIKRIAIVLVFFIGSFPALAQQNWYVFIQADDNQPFYARMAGKVYSSTSIGYLVIPGLNDSVYDLVIGFPKKQMNEQRFSVPINKKDHGFELKNNGGSWTLFNWQTQESTNPLPEVKKDNIYYGDKKTDDPFSEMMAAVVNDSAVLYKSVLHEEKPKLVKKPPVQPDSVVAVNEPVKIVKEEKKPVVSEPRDSIAKVIDTSSEKTRMADPINHQEVKMVQEKKKGQEEMTFSNPMIVKLQDHTVKTYRKIVYADATGEKIDTITILIPIETTPQGPKKPIVQVDSTNLERPKKPVVQVDSTTQKSKDTVANEATPMIKRDTAIIEKKDSITAPKRDAVIVEPVKGIITDTAKTSSAVPTKKTVEMVNSNCRNLANDNDIDKLRVKMIEASNLDGKLNVAKKLFRTKCLTSKEIKALSELFTSDDDKFSFFEACYPFVDDTDNFKQLYILLTDKSVIARFKTMVHLQ